MVAPPTRNDSRKCGAVYVDEPRIGAHKMEELGAFDTLDPLGSAGCLLPTLAHLQIFQRGHIVGLPFVGCYISFTGHSEPIKGRYRGENVPKVKKEHDCAWCTMGVVLAHGEYERGTQQEWLHNPPLLVPKAKKRVERDKNRKI
eukprot:sb/3474031/